MKDLKSKNPDIDANAIKVDVPTVNPQQKDPPYHAPYLPVVAAFPALNLPAHAPAQGQHQPNPAARLQFQLPAPAFGPAPPGQNPMGLPPPPLAVPWQFPQYVAPAPLIGNPQGNVQGQPIPAPPAPIAPVRQRRRANRTGNQPARNQPKRPAGRARR